MLQELLIRNFAIIENLQISFEEGMTVLTGETGAGKSIIIDAVGVLAGGRASSDLIRFGENKAFIQGLFSMPENEELSRLLESFGIEADDRQILLQRELTANGKNVARVNGTLVTVGTLREIGHYLIDIHGQNEHQELMNPQKHLSLLDQFGKKELIALKEEYLQYYQSYEETRKQLRQLETNEKENAQRVDLLSFQLNELEQARLEEDDEEELLEEERNLLVNYQRIVQALQAAYEALQNGEENGIDKIGMGMEAIGKIESISPAYQAIYGTISAAYYQLQEAAADISNEMDTLSYDEERLNEIEERLNLLHQLKRKYGNTIAEMKDYYQKIAAELEMIINRDNYIEKLTTSFQQAKKQLLKAGNKLSAKRKEAAGRLEEQIQLQLKELYMEKVIFKTEFLHEESPRITEEGLDTVEYYIATNVGEPLKPLAKIASGGELSRMMLAMKAIFTQTQGITSIIFDEVDTGVSGRVAQAIANKIHLVAEASQVLCISHLPQVAAMADHHYLIQKEIVAERTITHVENLEEDKRVNEIARMLAGTEITELSYAHARELLKLAETKKTQEQS